MSEEAPPYTTGKRANCDDHLQILSETIATHARKIAHEEWGTEHLPVLDAILTNSGLSGKATLTLEEREVPIELITRSIRERFLAARTKSLMAGLAEQVVSAAFKKVMEKE